MSVKFTVSYEIIIQVSYFWKNKRKYTHTHTHTPLVSIQMLENFFFLNNENVSILK